MIETKQPEETVFARESLKRLCDEKSVLHRVTQVLELIALQGVGLGEVLQDSAKQGCRQIPEFMRASVHICDSENTAEDKEVLENAHFMFKTIKSTLEMTPAAMRRNKLEALGEKEKLSSSEIAAIATAFTANSDVLYILNAENA